VIVLQVIGIIILVILVVVVPALFLIGTAVMGKQADELSANWASERRDSKLLASKNAGETNGRDQK